jgi:hypothetical protein
VIPDHEADGREVEQSLQNPHRFDHLLLFPKTPFEFYKWNRQDWVGFILSVAGVGLVLLFVWIAVMIGA